MNNISQTKLNESFFLESSYKYTEAYMKIKRMLDVACASCALVLLSPLLLIIAFLIKAEDKGPVLYKQIRTGFQGKKIRIYKFRSMMVNADDLQTVLSVEEFKKYQQEFKLDNDPRITKIGKFLRRTSLDELPQLINILQGKMSIVGPRPVLEQELEQYRLSERQMFLSRIPGLTGYWQAYARNNATYESGERQQMELYYAYNASLTLDIKILLKTVESVFKMEGAK